MGGLMRTLRAIAIVAPFGVAMSFVGDALHFGGLAWLAVLLGLMFLTSLVDREWFYGEPHPFARRPRSR